MPFVLCERGTPSRPTRPSPRRGANLFSRLVSACSLRASIVVTTDKHVRGGTEAFAGDEILTRASRDRRWHHVHIVSIDGRGEPARAPGGLRRVELRRRPSDRHGAGGCAAECLHDLGQLARRDALQVALDDRADERLLVPLLADDGARREEAGPVPGEPERPLPHPRDERPVAQVHAGGGPIERSHAGEAGDLVGPCMLGASPKDRAQGLEREQCRRTRAPNEGACADGGLPNE